MTASSSASSSEPVRRESRVSSTERVRETAYNQGSDKASTEQLGW